MTIAERADLPAATPPPVVSPESHVAALVARPAVGVSPGATLAEAAELMRRESVSALLAGSGAILTERDLCRAIAAGRTASDRVVDAATPEPVSVSGSTSVAGAAHRMLTARVRHLVVELDGGALGVVSIRDVLRALLQAAEPERWLRPLRGLMEPPETWLG